MIRVCDGDGEGRGGSGILFGRYLFPARVHVDVGACLSAALDSSVLALWNGQFDAFGTLDDEARATHEAHVVLHDLEGLSGGDDDKDAAWFKDTMRFTVHLVQ